LLKIAKEGIFLNEPLFNYENIKNHEYVIEISNLANQYFKIYTEKQYKIFVTFIKDRNSLSKLFQTCTCIYDYNRIICDLIIPTNFFLQQLIEEKKTLILLKIL